MSERALITSQWSPILWYQLLNLRDYTKDPKKGWKRIYVRCCIRITDSLCRQFHQQGRPKVSISNCTSPTVLRVRCTCRTCTARRKKQRRQDWKLEGTQSAGYNSSSDRSKRVSQQETLTRPREVVAPSQPYNSWLDFPFPERRLGTGRLQRPLCRIRSLRSSA